MRKLDYWKNYYGNSVIDMQVLPQFENLFSANGYLGKSNTTTSNRNMVFPSNEMNNMILYSDFAGTSLSSDFYISGSVSYTIDNMLNVTAVSGSNSGIYSNFTGENDTLIEEKGLLDQSGSYVNFGYYNYSGSYQGGAFIQSSGNNTFLQADPAGINFGTVGSYDGYALYSLTKVNNTTVNYQIGSESGTATFTNPIQTYGQVSPVFTNSQTFSNTWSVKWFLALHLSAMPTFTIGSGSVFQADATTTSEFSGSPGQDYNSTYQYFTYDIPLAPGTNYATVIFKCYVILLGYWKEGRWVGICNLP